MTHQEKIELRDKALAGEICAYCQKEFSEANGYAALCESCYPEDNDDLPITMTKLKEDESGG